MAESVYELEAIEDTDLDLESHFGKNSSVDRLRPTEAPTAERSQERAVERSSAESDSSYQKIIAKVQDASATQPVEENAVAQDASELHQAEGRESQVMHLLDIAKTKGVVHAVKVAEHAEDYFVLDQVHDKLLADEFHDALVRSDMIK